MRIDTVRSGDFPATSIKFISNAIGLRTGIELYMTINKLYYLQADLQAVKSVFNIFMLRPKV